MKNKVIFRAAALLTGAFAFCLTSFAQEQQYKIYNSNSCTLDYEKGVWSDWSRDEPVNKFLIFNTTEARLYDPEGGYESYRIMDIRHRPVEGTLNGTIEMSCESRDGEKTEIHYQINDDYSVEVFYFGYPDDNGQWMRSTAYRGIVNVRLLAIPDENPGFETDFNYKAANNNVERSQWLLHEPLDPIRTKTVSSFSIDVLNNVLVIRSDAFGPDNDIYTFHIKSYSSSFTEDRASVAMESVNQSDRKIWYVTLSIDYDTDKLQIEAKVQKTSYAFEVCKEK